MPGVPSNTGPWVFQWLELQSIGVKADRASVRQKALTIRRNKMGHQVALPSVAVKPKPAIHCEEHPVSTANKLPIHQHSSIGIHAAVVGYIRAPPAYEQAIKPSFVAGASAGAEPMKMAHWIGQASGCVTFADHPPDVAAPNEIVTPDVTRMLSALMSVVYAELS